MVYRRNEVFVQLLSTMLVITVVTHDGLLAGPPESPPSPPAATSPAEFTLPGLAVSKETERLIERLHLRLTEAQDTNDLDAARRAADELVSACEMFLGSKAWRSILARHYRSEVDRMRFLSDDQRRQVQEARASFQLARGLSVEGRHEEATALASEARLVQQRLLGPCSPSHFETLQFLVQLALIKRQFPEGEKLALEMAAICRESYGTDSPRFADAVSDLGCFYAAAGMHARAEPLLKQAADIRKRTLGPRSVPYAASLSSLGYLYCASGEVQKAEAVIREALALSEELGLTLSTAYADCLQNLAHIHYRREAYDEAEPLLREAITINEIHISSRREQLLATLNRFIVVLKKLGKDEDARAYDERLQFLRNERRSGGLKEEADSVAPEDNMTPER